MKGKDHPGQLKSDKSALLKAFPLQRAGSAQQQLAQNSKEALHAVISSWFSQKFMLGCAILFPIVITIYVTWWFLQFFDNFFSPLYVKLLGFQVFGLGFMTSMAFIFLTGIFFSSWLGKGMLSLGEYIVKKLPLVKHIYSASKQVSVALNPENGQARAFKECVIIKHPRNGEYAFGFITGECTLQSTGIDKKLFSVYVPTNHVYLGDIVLLPEDDVIHPNLSVREGLEILVSLGMSLPSNLIDSKDRISEYRLSAQSD
eukprot:TRINITY_DN1825_c1_g1_i1.p1 TRINITY_DN1825_c1_g1~~TRINITY_DN1825_c1_g1_i1.p1  ORF type:complete len:258 (-),score=23.30 TRINITY_DN1825_c1_g1_i1:454-1227(-)